MSSLLHLRSVGRSNFVKGLHNLIKLIKKRHGIIIIFLMKLQCYIYIYVLYIICIYIYMYTHTRICLSRSFVL